MSLSVAESTMGALREHLGEAEPSPIREPRAHMRRGIEKESLRVKPDGSLSDAPHPAALGSPLTHPQITTDFSESQPEFVTGVHDTPEGALSELDDIHRFVYQHIGRELLWPSSMPCIVGSEESIPIGQYGSSNIAQAKTIYRRGLGYRYGRLMQTISGIHYNFSLSDELWAALGRTDQTARNAGYFGLIRNFRRYSWLLIYLFGASPAICKSFIKGHDGHGLETFDDGSLYLPFATCLRMGRLGYQSDAQSELHVSYNTVDNYAKTLAKALSMTYEPYRQIGVQVNGEYRQLNDKLLQIENEFYGTIRPKQPIQSGERPLSAMASRGVAYVEVRCLDLNPFLRAGIDEHEMRFIDVFLLLCLMADSPNDSKVESARMRDNQLAVVERGREPGLQLQRSNGELTLMTDWARDIFAAIEPIAQSLDASAGGDLYSYTLEQQRAKIADPELTPSARTLATMREQKVPFFRFAMNQAIAHRGYFVGQPLRSRHLKGFQESARNSIERQQSLESSETTPFDQFLTEYLRLE